jgi:hypothetical protein
MAEKPSSLPKKPGQDGLTMHGHWTIDLKNPDGTIAEHREFENSLMNPGYLLSIVTGQTVPGDLGITIASTGSSVCTAANAGMPGPLGSCLVAASATAGLGGNTCFAVAAGVCNYNLKEFADLSNTGSGAITLSGYIPVLASGTVTGVGTQLMTCLGGIGLTTADPVSCYNQTGATAFYYGTLTGTSITALPVTAGQTIALSVVLSFS